MSLPDYRKLLQDYIKLADFGYIPALLCPYCRFELHLTGNTKNVQLHCYTCGCTLTPGVEYIRQIERALRGRA